MPSIDPQALRDYVTATFVAADVPPDDAADVSQHLVEANLKGHDSHGVVRVSWYLQSVKDGLTTAKTEIRIEKESGTTALIDGGWGFGQVIARRTMEIAIEKAKQSGVGIALAHQSTHVGRVGAYVEQAAAEGLIGFATANNHGGGHLVAAFGGTERRLSTNPMAYAFPTTDGSPPFVLDMATSVAAEGKMRVALNKGAEVPDGWLLDTEGVSTNVPAEFYGPPMGAIMPLGGAAGHKGFGLSMVVEALGGALSPAGTSRPDPERGGNGLFTMAIDPGNFGGADLLTSQMGVLEEWVKRPPYQEGVDEILVPGEPERRSMAEREANGIPLDEATWEQLTEAGSSVGVATPAL